MDLEVEGVRYIENKELYTQKTNPKKKKKKNTKTKTNKRSKTKQKQNKQTWKEKSGDAIH